MLTKFYHHIVLFHVLKQTLSTKVAYFKIYIFTSVRPSDMYLLGTSVVIKI